jgi:hypothetical protein
VGNLKQAGRSRRRVDFLSDVLVACDGEVVLFAGYLAYMDTHGKKSGVLRLPALILADALMLRDAWLNVVRGQCVTCAVAVVVVSVCSASARAVLALALRGLLESRFR